MEQLTDQMIHEARQLMGEIELAGGMAVAIEQGLPKLRIEEAAASKQARIDRGIDRIIGVNLFEVDDASELEVLSIDQDVVRNEQVGRLDQLKSERSAAEVEDALSRTSAMRQNQRQFACSGCRCSKSQSYTWRNEHGFGRCFWEIPASIQKSEWYLFPRNGRSS